MKKALLWIAILFAATVLGAYIRTLFNHSGAVAYNEYKEFNANEIPITRLFTDNVGQPLSGKVLITHESLKDFALAFYAFNQPDRFVFNYLPYNPNQLDNIKFKGLEFTVELKEGKANGKAKAFLNLRQADAMILDRDINKGLAYYIAYAFNPVIKIAEIDLKDNQFEGEGTIRYPNKNGRFYTKAIVNFSNNKLNGEAILYHENGTISRKANFKNGQPSGLQQRFYKSGGIYMENDVNEYANHFSKYYYENGQISKHVEFKDSRKLVFEKTWYPDGSTKKIDEYPNDSTHHYQLYYSNGELKEEIIDGRIQKYPPKGQIFEYYYNGQVKKDITYNKDGKKEGAYSIYYKSGEKWEEGRYKNDLLQGNFKKWYTNGQKAEDHTMVDGKIDGPYERYYYNGELWKKGTYVNGVLDGLYEKWFNNGQKAYSYSYTNGKLNGEYHKWYTDGTLRIKSHYKNGQLEGKYENWKADGSLYKSATYKAGKEVK